jgi:hypothetical protein
MVCLTVAFAERETSTRIPTASRRKHEEKEAEEKKG